jgi:hypothetical protein
MKIKILFRIVLLSLAIPIFFVIIDKTNSESILASEVHKLTDPALDELMICLGLSIWFLGTIVIVPVSLNDSGGITDLLSAFPLYFVLVLVFIKPIKDLFDKEKNANKSLSGVGGTLLPES